MEKQQVWKICHIVCHSDNYRTFSKPEKIGNISFIYYPAFILCGIL